MNKPETIDEQIALLTKAVQALAFEAEARNVIECLRLRTEVLKTFTDSTRFAFELSKFIDQYLSKQNLFDRP